MCNYTHGWPSTSIGYATGIARSALLVVLRGPQILAYFFSIDFD